MTHHQGAADGESQRQRDLVIQVRRFLKFAPVGTRPEVLEREARDFDRRLAAIEHGVMLPVAKKLRRELRRVAANGGGRP